MIMRFLCIYLALFYRTAGAWFSPWMVEGGKPVMARAVVKAARSAPEGFSLDSVKHGKGARSPESG